MMRIDEGEEGQVISTEKISNKHHRKIIPQFKEGDSYQGTRGIQNMN